MLRVYSKIASVAKQCTTISLGNRAASKTIQRSLCYGSKPDVNLGKNKPAVKENTTPKINHEALVNRASSVILDLYKTQPDIKKKIFQEYFWNPTVQSTANQVYPVARAFNLSKMTYVGFDYDYTLADYTDELQNLIYNLARDYLVNDMRYPAELLQKSYDPAFPIRGLFYDTKKGNLIKMDFLNNMQIGAVYFGRRPLRQTEIIDAYGGTHINSAYYGNLRPMIDRFALPETCLISDVIEFFVQKKLRFDPSYVYNDITKAVGLIHSTKLLHNEIMKNLPLYLKKDDAAGIATFLSRLKKAGKKLFLLTNSPYNFVDYGMSYIMNGQENIGDWKQLFDIIIVNGDKPNFFMSDRPFRAFDTNNGAIKWEQVNEFTPSNVYVEGCLTQFNRIVKPKGDSVAYFGDHLFGDAREPSRSSGWRTGVIIRELEQEIITQNSFEYIDHLRKLVTLEDLRRKFDLLSADPETDIMKDMELEVQRHRKQLKEMFNKHFGSAFRTFTNATLFAYLLQRYADVYTSKLENFNNYPLDYEFHPRRTFLPHELSLMKDIFPEWSGEGQEIEDF